MKQGSICGNDIAAMHRAQTLAKRLRVDKAVIFRCAQNHGCKPRQPSNLPRRGNFEKMHNAFRGDARGFEAAQKRRAGKVIEKNVVGDDPPGCVDLDACYDHVSGGRLTKQGTVDLRIIPKFDAQLIVIKDKLGPRLTIDEKPFDHGCLQTIKARRAEKIRDVRPPFKARRDLGVESIVTRLRDKPEPAARNICDECRHGRRNQREAARLIPGARRDTGCEAVDVCLETRLRLIGVVRDLIGEVTRMQAETEKLGGALAKLRVDHQAVKDELARLKHLPPRPPIKPSGMDKSTQAKGPEAGDEKGGRSSRRRGSQLDRLKIGAIML